MLRGRRAPVVAGVGALALVALMVVFLVLPKMNQVSSANEELQAAQGQQGTLESQLAALEQAEAAAPEAKATILEVERQIPPTVDEQGLLLLVRNAALRSGVTVANLTNLTPGTPALDPATGLSTIALAVSARGGYFQLTELLYNLETLPRAAKVTNISLAPGGGDSTGDGSTTPVVTNLLELQASVVLFTSDQSAGPGSIPGPTEDAAATEGP